MKDWKSLSHFHVVFLFCNFAICSTSCLTFTLYLRVFVILEMSCVCMTCVTSSLLASSVLSSSSISSFSPAEPQHRFPACHNYSIHVTQPCISSVTQSQIVPIKLYALLNTMILPGCQTSDSASNSKFHHLAFVALVSNSSNFHHWPLLA